MQKEKWKQVKELLNEVLEIEPAERLNHLENADVECEIRREVESLLAFEEKAGEAMQIPAINFSKDFFDGAKKTLIGQQIGVYRIVREIGYGGMGAVYLAERSDGKFAQQVALKLLKREMNTADLRRRFEREREILATLDHPNITRLLDAGTTDDGIPFLAMEYVEGLPIDSYCNKHQLDLNQRLNLFCEVCHAVDFAHRNLVVHRDLKPSNILVTNDGMPKLLDFGISKILSGEFDQTDSATVTKLGVMTPSYASPEQLQRKSVTTATDIYSLGIIFYELLSGHRPFEDKEDDLNEIYKAVIETDPSLPSVMLETRSRNFKQKTQAKTEVKDFEERSGVREPYNQTASFKARVTSPQAVNVKPQSLKGDLDNIILKALKKEPERRYLSAENLAEDIRRHQNGLPVTARPDTFAYRAGKFVKRNSLAVGAGALVLLAIIGGLAATLWQARVAQAERVKAENLFNDVRNLANSFLFEITPEIENLSGSTRAKELLVKRALEYLNRLSSEANDAELERELAAAYEKVGDVQGNPFQANIGDMQGALNSYEKARVIREKLFHNDPQNIDLKAELAKNLQLTGDVLFFTGEIAKANQHYRQAVDWQREMVQKNPSDSQAKLYLASAQYALGGTYFWNSEYEEALKNFYPAQEILTRLNETDPANDEITDKLGNVYVRIGETLSWQNQLEEGEKNVLKGLELIEPAAARHPNNAKYRKSLWTANIKAGEIFLDSEKLDKSLEHYQKALKLAKITVNDDPKNASAKRDLALSYNKVGDTLDSLGNGALALEHSKQALKLQREIAEADPKNFEIRRGIAGTYKRMGYAQTTMKDYKGSRESFQNALRQYEQLAALDPNDEKLPREIAIVSQTIGNTYIAGSSKAAHLHKALEWNEKSLALLLEMKEKGTLPKFDDKLIADIEAQIADIKIKLKKY